MYTNAEGETSGSTCENSWGNDYNKDHCTYEDGSITSYSSTWGENGTYSTTNCWGDSTVEYCSICTGENDATGMWVEDCVETGGDNEVSPEAALQENISHVEEAAALCGCELNVVGKLSNSLDLVICTFL
jgi:hypothetical protein